MHGPRSTEHTYFPVCPYCGYIHTDLTDLVVQDDHMTTAECERCELAFRVTCHVSIAFSTQDIPREGAE